MASLLIHSDAVPEVARTAIAAAQNAGPIEKRVHLAQAAHALWRETPLVCDEVYDLLCESSQASSAGQMCF